jgi:uncharacterized membrane protein YraQ (UPF0718 family)/YHS domain-containing protein
MTTSLHWITSGLRQSAAMVWMTWWPLIFGFTVSGLVQSFLPRDGLRHQLGEDTPSSAAKASLLGAISSSCSYAASAMARALFARGASWSNAMIFMIASTNLVIELGVVLYLLLGWQFVVAQIVGGVVMIIALSLLVRLFFSRSRQERLRQRVIADSPAPLGEASPDWRQRLRQRRNYSLAARFTLGDITMLRRELLTGFLVAGFLTVHVPALWWSHLFFSGHGALTVIENAVVAPLLAVVSFVCSVGNIPLAAALWFHGVAFGGVVSFIFADLVTLPLLLIYRRFYGTSNAARLFALFWLIMSGGGLLVEVLFRALHLLAHNRHSVAMQGQFPLGWTLYLNVAAAVALVTLWFLARRHGGGARDPICGMTVDLSAPVASRERDGRTYYFCSPRCAERFDAQATSASTDEPVGFRDPVCGMVVGDDGPHTEGPDGITYYFCGEACRSTFLANRAPQAGQRRSGEVIP